MFVLQECDRVVLRKEGAVAKVRERSFSAAKKKAAASAAVVSVKKY